MRTRILIVDDHLALAEAIAIAVKLQDDLEVVGTATTLNEAVALAATAKPDVVLLDVHLSGEDGIDGIRDIKAVHPPARIVVLTGDANPHLTARATIAGACGFLLKSGPIDGILSTIRNARDGGLLLDRATLASVLTEAAHSPQPRPDPGLTPRELEVLHLMGDAFDAHAIAKTLGVSLSTSRSHIKNVLMKLGVHTQLEAVITAMRAGIIPSPR